MSEPRTINDFTTALNLPSIPTKRGGVEALFTPDATPIFQRWAARRLAPQSEPDDSHWMVPDLGGEEW